MFLNSHFYLTHFSKFPKKVCKTYYGKLLWQTEYLHTIYNTCKSVEKHFKPTTDMKYDIAFIS